MIPNPATTENETGALRESSQNRKKRDNLGELIKILTDQAHTEEEQKFIKNRDDKP